MKSALIVDEKPKILETRLPGEAVQRRLAGAHRRSDAGGVGTIHQLVSPPAPHINGPAVAPLLSARWAVKTIA